MLLINFAPAEMDSWVYSPEIAFGMSLLVYALLVGLIILQNRWIRSTSTAWRIVNVELILFLSGYYFLMGAHRVFGGLESLSASFTLLLYFLGIGIHLASCRRNSQGLSELRLLLPLVIPFLLLTLIAEAFSYLPSSVLQLFDAKSAGDVIPILTWSLAIIAFCLLLAAVMPLFMVWAWQCRPMPSGPLRERLETLCARAHFRYSDLMLWTVLGNALTAGIIGVFPRMRYILFTPRVLNELPPEDVEAILAHEIGHQYRCHLWLYPLILIGASLAISAVLSYWTISIGPLFENVSAAYPSLLWEPAEYFAIFLICAVTFALYFRYIFGFFSRLFERQADLHVFVLGIDPDHLIHSLDEVGRLTGHSHEAPSWHHYSIKERMDFLNAAKQNLTMADRHHHRVKLFVAGFTVLLFSVFIVEVLWL